jgi:hypothetical protein
VKLNFNGISYDAVEIPKPEPPYILMDILSKERNISRGIQIISMNGRSEIKIVKKKKIINILKLQKNKTIF